MPMDVYAVIGALVRTEITRTHQQPPHPPRNSAAVRDEIAAPEPPAASASPAPVRRRLRTRATAVLRRLAAIPG